MTKNRIATLAFAFALAGVPVGASAQTANDCGINPTSVTVRSTDVTSNTTWSGVNVLSKPIFVKNGAILTILPGTIVRGQPRSGPVVPGSQANTPGALIVTQNGRLIADASASNPIIMTTAAVDNDNDGVADDDDNNGFEDAWVAGDKFLDDKCVQAPLAPLNTAGDSNVALWGGLVLLGNAPTNMADKALGATNYGKATVEGLTVPGFPAADATYGGVQPHDNSGILRYVSVRHAGDEIGNGNELNGITLAGVGDGTTISHVEVYANFDDGIEWFGGTVNGDHLAVFMAGDDQFDVDQGYTGVNQFLFAVMAFFTEDDGDEYGSKSSDKGTEFDGDDYRPDLASLNGNVNGRINWDLTVVDPGAGSVGAEQPTPWPLSNPAYYNLTLIGATPDAGSDFTPVSGNGTKRGVQFRNGFAGELHNSIIVNTGTETGIEVDTGTNSPPGWSALNNTNAGLLSVVCTTMDDGAALGAAETTAINNGNAIAVSLGGTAPASNNAVNPAGFGLVNEDTTFDTSGTTVLGRPGKLAASLKSSPIDPRPASGGFPPPPIAGCPAPGSGLDPAATYRGAFPTGTNLWTDGWTTFSMGGLL